MISDLRGCNAILRFSSPFFSSDRASERIRIMPLYPRSCISPVLNEPIAEIRVERQSSFAFFSLTAFSAARSPPPAHNSKASAGGKKPQKRAQSYNNNMMKRAERRLKVSSRKVLVPTVSKISRRAYQERGSRTQFTLTNCAAGKQEFKSSSREPPSYCQPSLLPLPPAPLSFSPFLSHTHSHTRLSMTLGDIKLTYINL